MTFDKNARREMSEEMMDDLFGDRGTKVVVITLGGDRSAMTAAQILANAGTFVVTVEADTDLYGLRDEPLRELRMAPLEPRVDLKKEEAALRRVYNGFRSLERTHPNRPHAGQKDDGRGGKFSRRR